MRIIKKEAKRVFTPTKIPGADYVINQYIGCQHACKYCYAKFMCKWYKYGKWGEWVVVKDNLPNLVKNEKPSGTVVMSSVSDPYQPIEREFKLTRGILESMNKDIALTILTKSKLVLRDLTVFRMFSNIEVGLTVNGFDSSVKAQLEPFSSSHSERVESLKELHENKIKNYMFVSPIIPHLVDVKELINETKEFVDSYFFEFINLKASGREFREWLKENYPESYKIVSNNARLSNYMKSIRDLIKQSKIRVRGIYAHGTQSL